MRNFVIPGDLYDDNIPNGLRITSKRSTLGDDIENRGKVVLLEKHSIKHIFYTIADAAQFLRVQSNYLGQCAKSHQSYKGWKVVFL